MRVLDKTESTMSNHCVVCGVGLDRNSMDVIIDTGYDFDLPGFTLDGRKYIGQCCVWDIAKAAGLTTATQLAGIKDYLRTYRNAVEEIQATVESHLDDATQKLNELPAAPNIDHLESPAHVLVAEAAQKKAKKTVKVELDEAPF